MFRYVDLCVELKRGRLAKDGLIHYRNVCQQVNVNSLEEVIKYFLKSATDKAEEAKSKAAEATSLGTDDLEADATAEDLMLSYVSGEKGKDRTDRELVTPWFKFLWETYRSVLDNLRNNARLEALYAMTATKAFQFCLTYKRTTEFRRLCDILRNHLANLNKYRDPRDRPDLTNPDSLNLYLESRFEQLRVACELDLWQEAFRSVEDIQGLIAMGKRPPRPQLMATYYAKLTKIFSVSDSHLYNGYAWYKLYNLERTYNKNLTAADTQLMATSVVLAALCIPLYESHRSENEAELDRDRSMRMAHILGFSADGRAGDPRSALSRQALITDLTAKGLPSAVPEEVRHILTLLEHDFNPLELCKRLQPTLDKLSSMGASLSSASPVGAVDPSQFCKPLQQVAVVRLMQQLSQVYSLMTIPALQALVPFMSFAEVEKVVVEAVKFDYLQPDPESEARKMKIIAKAAEETEKEHSRALARKLVIERRKEEAEQQLMQAELEEEKKRLHQARMSEAMEEERRRADRVKREEDRIQKEIQEKEEEEARNLLAEARKRGSKVAKIKEGEKLDKRTVQEVVLSEQSRAREEAEKKMGKLIKHMDHLERARREGEAPLLEAAYAKKVEADQVRHEREQEEWVVQHRQAWDLDSLEKQRLLQFMDAKEEYAEQIIARRTEQFEALRKLREKKIAEKRQQKRTERDLKRKHEFVRRCRERIEEARLQEEKEALERELEQQKKEEAERARKLEEQAERQRRREAEVEARKEEERKAAAAAPPASAATTAPSGGGGYQPPARRTGAFVPPAARATPNGEQNAPSTEGRGDRWTPPSRAGGAPAAEEAGGGDNRWRRPSDSGPSPSDRLQPPAKDPPRANGVPGGGGDRWRPPGARGGEERRPGDSFGERRNTGGPSGDRDRDDRRSSGGGAFQPSFRRDDNRRDDRPRSEWPASGGGTRGGGGGSRW
ncbi:hypothetical protein WJX73_010183 [Symbiochloris irregularis]|uniref:eIF3a PCI domain-containing protein n=1 Tax=Symbiochloris irregularis TaxID=706552 RepID=A0AAW1PYH1_9CHLO